MKTEILIEHKERFNFQDLTEIWKKRELFYIFAWRDIKVRYKQTLLGISWVVIQPLANMLIFTVLFGKLAKIPSGNLPYSVFVLTGIIFWTYFSNTLSHSNDSLIANENIIKKIYFPKIILPLSSLVVNFIDFSINTFLLLVLASFFGHFPSIQFFYYYPFAILIASITACGLGLFISSLNVKYRDIRYILPFFIQILFFVTPIIFPLSIMSDRNRLLIAINPMTTVVESARLIFGGTNALNPQVMSISIFSAIFIFLIGIIQFKKTERYFADII